MRINLSAPLFHLRSLQNGSGTEPPKVNFDEILKFSIRDPSALLWSGYPPIPGSINLMQYILKSYTIKM